MKIPLFKIDWTYEDITEITKVIQRGKYWATGEEIEDFEEAVAYKIGMNYAVACNSGTSGLHLSLIASGIKKGDEVIVPSYTFISTVNSIRFVGAKPIFADIERKTFGLHLEDVKKKITKKTKAIILVHYGGCPAFFTEEIKKLCKEKNIKLIEDAAAALTAKINSHNAGTFGDFGVFSFCQNKPITSGEGGMIVTNSKEDYKKLKLLVSHGKQGDNYVSLGYNFRMSSINAALGLSQFRRIDSLVIKRRKIANEYYSKFHYLKEMTPFKEPPSFYSTYWIYPITVKKEIKKPLMNYLIENKIFTKSYYMPVHLTKYYSDNIKLPATENTYNSSFCLPIYPTLTNDEVNYIKDKVCKFFNGEIKC